MFYIKTSAPHPNRIPYILLIAAINTAIPRVSMFYTKENIHAHVLNGYQMLRYVNVLHHMSYANEQRMDIEL